MFNQIWQMCDEPERNGGHRGRVSFPDRLSAAIRMGVEGPPILSQYLMEQEMWQRLGITRGIPLDDRPHRELADYLLIISLLQREEAAARRQKPGGR